MRLITYTKYWLKVSELTFDSLIATRLSSILFISGKLLRFAASLWFLLILNQKLKTIGGYQLNQVIIFYLIYNLFDLLAQFFYRGIYWFRNEIVSGTFDFTLVKPLNPLFQMLTSHTDFLDLPLIVLTLVMLIIYFPQVSLADILVFSLVSFSALVLLTAVHIIVGAIGVITTEVDHTIWIFRDLSRMAWVPTDIYTEAIRAFLTFVIPVALMFTFPAKSLLGLLSWQGIILTLLASVLVYFLSLKFWHYALKNYSSASS